MGFILRYFRCLDHGCLKGGVALLFYRQIVLGK